MNKIEKKNKDIALVTAIIVKEEYIHSSWVNSFDQAYLLAQGFVEKYPSDFNWEESDIDFESAIYEYVQLFFGK